MSNDLGARLREALAETEHSPALHERLLYEASEELEQLRAQRGSLLNKATAEICLNGTTDLSATVHGELKETIAELERLRQLLVARIKRGGNRGDDDAPGMILADPPKRPRGPLPATAILATVDGDDAHQEV